MALDLRLRFLLWLLARRALPPFESLAPSAARAQFDAMCRAINLLARPAEAVGSATDQTVPGPNGSVPVRVYTPAGGEPVGVLVYYHGGGWVLGGLAVHDRTCRTLANRARCVVINVDYGLAPESRFPRPLEDAYAAAVWATRYLDRHDGMAGRIAVAGDSAGGNLAAAVALMARDRDGPEIVAQVLLYPVCDAALALPSVERVGTGTDYGLTKATLIWFVQQYAGTETDRRTPYLSPLWAEDHARLPRALVITAGFDPLHDEGAAYAAALTRGGVAVEHRNYPSMVHGFAVFTRLLPHARDALVRSAEFVRSAFAVPNRELELPRRAGAS